MATKIMIFKVEGPEEIVDSSTLAIVKNNGWTESSQISVEQKLREVVRSYLIQQAQEWYAKQALLQAEQATNAAIEATTMTVQVQNALQSQT